MIAFKKQYFIFLTLFMGLFIAGCNDKWEDHYKIQDPVLGENLLVQIKKNPDLSKFAEYLTKTGYDKVYGLGSDKRGFGKSGSGNSG
jgi:hypothetical protein